MRQKFDIEDYTLTARQLNEKYNPWGYEGQHPRFTRAEWRTSVSHQETLLGYWEWVVHQLDTDEEKPL